jgi:putative cardiolipin synthase
LKDTPTAFERLARETVWGTVRFLSDRPGKNDGAAQDTGISAELAKLVAAARNRIVIQSPYLVLSDEALALFRDATARGVRVRINTNSLASTDNLPAFGGYRNQREELLKLGLELYEYRPDAASQNVARKNALAGQLMPTTPIYGLHAKTVVLDGEITFIGTFNLDPRSQNLNTEVGALMHDRRIAQAVEAAMEEDMQPANSWNAATADPDQYASAGKRAKARMWQWMPIKPLL